MGPQRSSCQINACKEDIILIAWKTVKIYPPNLCIKKYRGLVECSIFHTTEAEADYDNKPGRYEASHTRRQTAFGSYWLIGLHVLRACTLPRYTCVRVIQAVCTRFDTNVVPRCQGRVFVKVVVGEKVEGELGTWRGHDGNVL